MSSDPQNPETKHEDESMLLFFGAIWYGRFPDTKEFAIPAHGELKLRNATPGEIEILSQKRQEAFEQKYIGERHGYCEFTRKGWEEFERLREKFNVIL